MENDEILEFDINQSGVGERPAFLTTLCVLSWITGGFVVLVYGLMVLAKNTLMEAFSEARANMDAEQKEGIDFIVDHYDQVFLSGLIFYAISIVAVILMFKQNKIGFYIYAPLHLFIHAYAYSYTPFELGFGAMFSIAITLGFIVMYGANLKHMK